MKKYLGAIIGVVALMMLVSTSAFAGNPEAFNVNVSVAAAADITIVSGIPVDFGAMGLGNSKVSATPVVIKNSGSGSNQTYSLKLTNPSGWTAVTTDPEMDKYRLSAAFDADGTVTWDPANHALTTSSQAASATKFASDETGTGVPYNAERHLYMKMETPTKTMSPGAKTIPITIDATVD